MATEQSRKRQKNEGVEEQHTAKTTSKEISRKEHPYFKNEKKERGPQTDYAHGRTHPATAEATTGIDARQMTMKQIKI